LAAVVADASPLIALHQLDHLGLLERLFTEVLIPPVVAQEVSPSLPVLPAWIRIRQLSRPIGDIIFRTALGQGETEALGLAKELAAELVSTNAPGDSLPSTSAWLSRERRESWPGRSVPASFRPCDRYSTDC
jgi:hypothetical protein